MHGRHLAELNGGEQEVEILDLIFRVGRPRKVAVDQGPSVDRQAFDSQEGKRLERITLLRLRPPRRGRSSRRWPERRKVCKAIFVFDDGDQRIAQADLFNLDPLAQQGP